MSFVIVGGLPSDPVRTGDKFRATWDIVAGKLLPGSFINADAVAHTVQEALPQVGFYTVSNPNAVPGDTAIVFDVRSTGAFAGGNLADVANALDRLPALQGGWATDLAKLQPIPLSGLTAAELLHDQEQARKDGNAQAQASSITSKIGATLKNVGLVAALIGGAVLFVVLQGKSRDW